MILRSQKKQETNIGDAKMRKTFCVVALVFLIIFCTRVNADEISEQVLKLKEKIIELQNKGELGFRNFTVCSKIFTFGSYIPLKEPKIKYGGKLLVYFEPANIFTNKLDGRYDIWVTQDMIVLAETGEVLLEKEDALTHRYNTASPVLDLFCQNTVTLGTLPPGKYVFKAVLHDKLKDASASKSITFEVVK